MSELEDKLNTILGDPQAMGQIMALAQSLGSGKDPQPEAPPQSDHQEASPPPSGQGQGSAPPDLSALLGSLTGEGGGLDPRLLTLGARIMSEYNADDGGRTALLQALRPFVKERRYAKLDRAIQIAKLSRLIRVALEVLRGGGQDHV